VYRFAANFYKVTKGKTHKNINDALISLCSGVYELGQFLSACSSNSPTAHLNGTAVEWGQYPLLCNLRSQFLVSTSHILAVKEVIISEEIDAEMFRRAPRVWVHAVWERLRTVQFEYVGHSNEQFVWVIQHILPQLHHRFSAQKIENEFRASWRHKPDTVPENVGEVILRNIQQIEMSGPIGDPSRNLVAAIQRYSLGKTKTTTSTTPPVTTASYAGGYTPRYSSYERIHTHTDATTLYI
jgi:hypothetical protein